MLFIRPLKLNIAKKLEGDKKYRERFFRGQAQDIIAMNIRELRKNREMRQSDLANESGMLQSSISRIEQAEYSAWSFKTLFRVANALDARLSITLEPVEDVIKEYKKMEVMVEKQQQEEQNTTTSIACSSTTVTPQGDSTAHVAELIEMFKKGSSANTMVPALDMVV